MVAQFNQANDIEMICRAHQVQIWNFYTILGSTDVYEFTQINAAPRTFLERNNPARNIPEVFSGLFYPLPSLIRGKMARLGEGEVLASYPDNLTFRHPSPSLVPFPLT